MTKNTLHRLIGYDRSTDAIVFDFEIPDRAMNAVKRIARVGEQDPDAIGSYPLDSQQARELAELLRARIDPGSVDYFLEPFERQQAQVRKFR